MAVIDDNCQKGDFSGGEEGSPPSEDMDTVHLGDEFPHTVQETTGASSKQKSRPVALAQTVRDAQAPHSDGT